MSRPSNSISFWDGLPASIPLTNDFISSAGDENHSAVPARHVLYRWATHTAPISFSFFGLLVCFLKRVWCRPSWLSTPDSPASTSQVPAVQACTTIPVLNLLNIWTEVYYLIARSHRCEQNLHDQRCRVGGWGRTCTGIEVSLRPSCPYLVILCHLLCPLGLS